MKAITFLITFITGLWSLVFVSVAVAQVTSDSTTNTIVNPNGNNFNILNGVEKGNNLFHSFSNFSVPVGGAANFDLTNTPNINTIFSRVTGGNVSNIDGLIQTLNGNKPVNLFLINPAGIIFGKDASLNIGGSFVGTTANSIKFADGVEFSTANAISTPLLTMSAPIGLQMGSNPGAITNNGAQLEVPSSNTLALIGGDITQTGGRLHVGGGNGRIELVSLGENSQAGMQPVAGGWSIDTRNTQNLRDLRFTQQANIDGSGNGSASITAVGRNFLLSDNSRVQGYNRGNLPGGAITINASESILLQEASDIRTDVDGSGNAGNLLISAPKITLYNEGSVVSVAWGGTGNAGSISLQGKDVTVTSDPRFLVNGRSTRGSGIVTLTLSQGNASDIKILTDTLTYSNGAGLANLTFGKGNSGTTTLISQTMTVRNSTGGGVQTHGTGNGGDLNIITDSFYMDGSSGYTASSYGREGEAGKAGNINVTARSIVARDDSGFNSDTFGSGNAGNITLKADYIELDDTQLNSRTSGSGNAGKINVSAQTLRLLNGGQLNVATKASGNGGSITVNANTIELNGEPTRGVLANKNTGFVSSVLPDSKNPNAPTGKGGNIDITTSSLMIRDGALISSSTSAGQGKGGDINLQVDRLDALDGGQVMAITRSRGDAGTITINARERLLLSGSDNFHEQRQAAYIPGQTYSDVEYNIGSFSGIFANATANPLANGSGGNLRISGGELRIQDGAIVNVSSQGTGNAGNLSVNMNALYMAQKGRIEAEATAGSQGNIFLNLDNSLVLRQGSTITTNATGTANGGNIRINAPVILGLENSDIIANAVQGRGGNIDITTQGIIGLAFRNTLTPREDLSNDITASSEFNVNGNVQVNNIGVDPNSGLVELPTNVTNSSQQIANSCDVNRGSSFVATGRGGIPQNPNQQMGSERAWSDVRDLTGYRKTEQAPAQIIESRAPLVQATGWWRNAQGKVELIATQPVHVQASLTCNAFSSDR